MKIIYSKLKKLLPKIKKTPRQVADDLTMLGHFADSIEKNGSETIIGLEVRQNRGDCLSYLGIAKELSVFYNTPAQIFKINLPKTKLNYSLPIKVTAKKETKRIIALRVSKIKNSSSPKWLKRFLQFHDINSINLLVDLTNYIALIYGIPCHAFDTKKSGNQLTWEINQNKYKKFTTLDQTFLELKKDTFIISDKNGAASLVMLGSKRAAIDLNTTETIIEMAVYDRVRVRQNAKSLNVVTEAGLRLEKGLDPKGIPQAHSHLIQLVLKYCGGEITSKTYDYYPQKQKPKKILLDLKKPSLYAGVKISDSFSKDVLARLGCKIKSKDGQKLSVTPPSFRKDINLEEDLIEEIIRFYGYNQIPTDQPIKKNNPRDITPKILYLIDWVKSILTALGYDEVRSWPLIQEKYFYHSKILNQKVKPVYVQNSINSDFPVLRQSIISSLARQKKQYQKYKLPQQKFFEVGKIFYKAKNEYQETHSLAIYQSNAEQLLIDTQELIEKLGAKNKKVSLEQFRGGEFIEINLEELQKQVSLKDLSNWRNKLPRGKEKTTDTKQAAHELTRQIIDLDANVVFKKEQDPKKLLTKYSKKIGSKYLWQLTITDIYRDHEKKVFKYTFKALYYNLDDKSAKKLHLNSFNLL